MNLDELRKRINEVDLNIIKALSERRKLSKEIIQAKDISEKPIRDRKREEELLSILISEGKKQGLDSHYISKLFYEIIEDSLRIQQSYIHGVISDSGQTSKSIKVAIQGIEGSYSFLASKKFFTHYQGDEFFIKKDTFKEVIQSVEKGEADFAFLPVENTTSGSINEVYDLLLHTTLSIIGEEKFQVKHCLVASTDIPLHNIKKIYAHYQAAAQCEIFLSSLPDCQVEYFKDTAMSVKKIKEEGIKHHAAIASEEAAQLFNVKIIKTGIANQEENFTRFVVCARKPINVDQRIPSKTSLVMATSQTPGALSDALLVMKKYNLNMTKLESRPIIGNPWEEMFYVDFAGNIADEKVQEALDELGQFSRFLKILGSYPTQDIPRIKLDFVSADSEKIPEVAEGKNEPKADQTSHSVLSYKPSYKFASREYKKEDTIIKVRDVEIGGDNFVIIAGPCSVESNEQIMACALEAKENGAQILRGGCFKPRTSPYSFQGLEFEGLKFLNQAGKIYSIPVITEVLAPEQVREVAKYSDILQVGARNMQNFSLLKEVGRMHRPVMLKRGMMSSIKELLNAAEYILSHGNKQVILCERGIRTFETATRNTLDLSVVPILKELTHLPVFVDPSHAVGIRDKVSPIAKAAKVIGAHGIMIEFHPNPDEALSDGEQSLTFEQFETLTRDLKKINYEV